ncbi:inorganic phosphate transporter [Helicobacter didelphidarum]|nr:inorganic phosphate transporter [Helicobacter didelphidarum]
MDDMIKYKKIENATSFGQKDLIKIGIVLLFFIIASVIAIIGAGSVSSPIILIFATVVGGYMALNIGANDVANNVGPAVGSHAITLVGAIIIAAIAEAAGAIIAGSDVVDTIKSGIISPASLQDSKTFVYVMIAALTSGAIWLHVATALGAPVSTTHSLVGGVLGAGIMAGGFGIANWNVMSGIALSWVISPCLGGLIAMFFLFVIKQSITYQSDKINAAKKVVPLLIFIMSWCFSIYLVQKTSFSKSINFNTATVIGLITAIAIFFISRPFVIRKADSLSNTKEDINELFTMPLIFSAAILSFAHGANDVANAIGPLAGIYEAISEVVHDGIGGKAKVPLWIMLIGGLGISLGLALYGPRLIKTVGSEITELDKMRAFCVALSAAITVLIASQLGLPVSSTHIAIGAIFGVGFLREYLKKRYFDMQQDIIEAHKGKDEEVARRFLNKFHRANIRQKQEMLQSLKNITSKDRKVVDGELPQLKKKERKSLKKAYKQELVRRSAINRIVASWLITVPLSAVFGAVTYYLIAKIGVPL